MDPDPEGRNHRIIYSTNNGIDKGASPSKWHKKQATVYDLAVDVYRGHPFTSVFKNNQRKKANFLRSWIVALDFDCGDDRASFDRLLDNDVVREFAAFLYYTPSCKPPVYKSRVVFSLARPVETVKEYEDILRAMAWMFPESDQSTAEAARLFFGSKGRDLKPLWRLLPLEVAREFVRRWRWEKPDVIEAGPKEIQPAGDVSEALLRGKADFLTGKIESCEDGKKYETLRNMAITFGGYVAGGYYSQNEVVKWLREAIDKRDVKSQEHAYKTIDESIEYGKARPLYFEVASHE